MPVHFIKSVGNCRLFTRWCLASHIYVSVMHFTLVVSDVTLTEGARGQGMVRCPLIKNKKSRGLFARALRRGVQETDEGPQWGPVGIQGQSPRML